MSPPLSAMAADLDDFDSNHFNQPSTGNVDMVPIPTWTPVAV